MATILKEALPREDGAVEILIEVDDPRSEDYTRYQPYGPTRGAGEFVSRSFRKAMILIRVCAEEVAGTVTSVKEALRPDGVEVQFGIKLDGEVGALITKKGVEAQLQVKLKWEGSKKA